MDLGAVGDSFDGRDVEAFSAARNVAVHGGGEEMDLEVLIGIFVRIVDSLLDDLSVDRLGYWGPWAHIAVEVRGGEEQRLRDEVRRRIAIASELFESLDEESRAAAVRRAEIATATTPRHLVFQCPACENDGLLGGWYTRRIVSEEVMDEAVFFVEKFSCSACELWVEGQTEIRLGNVVPSLALYGDEIPQSEASSPSATDLAAPVEGSAPLAVIDEE